MTVQIEPYTKQRISRVTEFNGRLRGSGVPFQFPEEHFSVRFPKGADTAVYQEYFLAVEGEEVRGGYILKHQKFTTRGQTLSGAFLRLPISEGIINRKYALVGVKLIQDAMERQPLLMGSGMGDLNARVVKLNTMMGWGVHEVPFYFRVLRPYRFFKGIIHLRKTRLRKVLLDLLATTGLGWLTVKGLQARPGRSVAAAAGAKWQVVDSFGEWADELWGVCQDKYLLIANRDTEALNRLYPPGNDRFLRLKVLDGDQVVGWAVVLNTQMSENKYFGNLRLGSIADTLAVPERSSQVVLAATRFLATRGVDLIVSNQCHAAWCRALSHSGFLKGPSNFLFSASPRVLELLRPFDANKHKIHINRGDGDGPIHL